MKYLTILYFGFLIGCNSNDTSSSQSGEESTSASTSEVIMTIGEIESKLEDCMMPKLRAEFESRFENNFDEIETNLEHQKLFVGCTVDPGYPHFSWVCARFVCARDFENELSTCDAFQAGHIRGNAVFIGNYLSDFDYLDVYSQSPDWEYSSKERFEVSGDEKLPEISGTLIETPEEMMKKDKREWLITMDHANSQILECK